LIRTFFLFYSLC